MRFFWNKSKFEKLKEELTKLNFSLNIQDGYYKNKNRVIQFYGYETISLWENGICLQSNTKVKNLKEFAHLIIYWCELRLSGSEIENKLKGFNITIHLKLATENIEEFIYKNWTDIKVNNKEFAPLIELLMADTRTKSLMAFIQLFDLGLSEYVGNWNGSFINQLPRIRITDDNKYKVMTPQQAFKRDMDFTINYPDCFLGFGNAKEAFDIIVSNLPSENIKAKYMTEEEWNNCNK